MINFTIRLDEAQAEAVRELAYAARLPRAVFLRNVIVAALAAGRHPAARPAALSCLDNAADGLAAVSLSIGLNFQDLCQALSDFKAQFGHCNVPQNFVTTAGIRLGYFCGKHRGLAKSHDYPPERREALEALGFDFNDQIDARFQARLQALIAYKEVFGHCHVLGKHKTKEGFWLGRWCREQRLLAQQPNYPTERRAALEAIGFDFGDRYDAAFEGGCQALAVFQAEFGHCDVPHKYEYKTPEHFPLGPWCHDQRRAAHQIGNRYPAERRVALQALGFDFGNQFDAAFERGRQALAAFKAEHGHCDVPQRYKTADGFALGMWLKNQKKEAKRPGYPLERRQALEALGLDFGNQLDAAFERGRQALAAFKTEHGHCDVPYGHKTPEGYSLGRWCRLQRQSAKRADYPAERREALQALGFDFGNQNKANEGVDRVHELLPECAPAQNDEPPASDESSDGDNGDDENDDDEPVRPRMRGG